MVEQEQNQQTETMIDALITKVEELKVAVGEQANKQGILTELKALKEAVKPKSFNWPNPADSEIAIADSHIELGQGG